MLRDNGRTDGGTTGKHNAFAAYCTIEEWLWRETYRRYRRCVDDFHLYANLVNQFLKYVESEFIITLGAVK